MCSDLALFLLPVATALIAGAATNSPAFTCEFAGASALLLSAFAVSISAFTYLVSFFFTSAKSVLKYLSTILLFAVTVPLCLLFSLSTAMPNTANLAAYVLSVFPGLALAWGVFQVSVMAIIAHELERQVPVWNIFVRTPEGHLSAGAQFTCFTGTKVQILTLRSLSGYYILMLLGSALLFFLAAVRKDLETYRHPKSHVYVPNEGDNSPESEDSDVVAERDAIEMAGKEGARHLCVHHLRKVYGHGAHATVAVKGLSVSADIGECLCILGPNGAGKSSTLSMLSGELAPSGGTALIGGKSIYTQLLEVFSILGICGQADIIWESLTGREHLVLACSLRRIPVAEHEHVVCTLLDDLGFKKWADKPVKVYSGGTRRKLCVAIALVGGTSMVLLDEPSTGVDPVSKRLMWDLLRKERQRRTLVLTTHSMTEAEALSSRIAIMGKGELRCIGSPQHIKSKYGRGVYLQVQAPPASAPILLSRLQSLFHMVQPGEAHGQTQVPSRQVGIQSGEVHVASSSSFQGNMNVIVTMQGEARTSAEATERGDAGQETMIEQVVDGEIQFMSFCLQCTDSRNANKSGGGAGGAVEGSGLMLGGLPLADLFSAMEEWKAELKVADYSISQVTLEQVFLTVTREEKSLQVGTFRGL